MPSASSLLVEAVRYCCEADRVIHRLLSAAGYRRRFYSTKGQDRWVIERVFDSRRGGYFVEIGAADGCTHSNTYALERDFNWTGIVIEANPTYISELYRNRTCHCVHTCVDGQPGEVSFFNFGFMGGIVGQDTDNASSKRAQLLEKHGHRVANMQTRSLQEILESARAPAVIDYLSIDVEGAEHRILAAFPFDRFRFESITVERPTPAVHGLLKKAGYVLDRIHRYDGFYLSSSRASKLGIRERPFAGVSAKFF